MLCHEHAHTSKLPYLDEGYSFQASVEANVERKMRNLKRKAEAVAARRRAGARPCSPDDDGDDDDGVDDDRDDDDRDGSGRGGGRRGAEENAFLPGLVGSAVTYEEERLAEFLEGDRRNDDDDDNEGDDDDDGGEGDNAPRRKKRRKRREFNYYLPLDFKELASVKIGIPPPSTRLTLCRLGPTISHRSLSHTHTHMLSHYWSDQPIVFARYDRDIVLILPGALETPGLHPRERQPVRPKESTEATSTEWRELPVQAAVRRGGSGRCQAMRRNVPESTELRGVRGRQDS